MAGRVNELWHVAWIEPLGIFIKRFSDGDWQVQWLSVILSRRFLNIFHYLCSAKYLTYLSWTPNCDKDYWDQCIWKLDKLVNCWIAWSNRSMITMHRFVCCVQTCISGSTFICYEWPFGRLVKYYSSSYRIHYGVSIAINLLYNTWTCSWLWKLYILQGII